MARADSGDSRDPNLKYNTEFGYSRKDVILIGVGLIALGYALYYGLQATGLDAGLAGNWVQLIIFMGICVGWISTYIFRVATKVRQRLRGTSASSATTTCVQWKIIMPRGGHHQHKDGPCGSCTCMHAIYLYTSRCRMPLPEGGMHACRCMAACNRYYVDSMQRHT